MSPGPDEAFDDAYAHLRPRRCDECREVLPGLHLILARNDGTDRKQFCGVECLAFWAVNHVEPDE